MFSRESDIVRTMRLIEGLKAELIANIGDLYKALAAGGEQVGKELLATVIVNCYVLGKRLGIDFDELDEAVKYRAERCGKSSHALEERFGDFSRLARHLEQKR